MKLSLIAATSTNHVIGKNNQLPWRLPADLAHFKKITMGKPIIMGRKTFESIGRALPGRRNIVISKNPDFQADHIAVFSSIDDALKSLKNEPEVMIIGGAQLYHQTLDRADRIYLTLIHHDVDGDAFFPVIDLKKWKMISEEKHNQDEKNAFDYSFLVYDLKQSS